MARGFRPRGRGFSVRRKTSWSRGPNGDTTRTGTGAIAFAVGAQALEDGLTIIRIRGVLTAYLNSVAATTDFMEVGVGIANFSENAFGTGIGALELPITDADWDGWMWHHFFTLGGFTGTGSSGAITLPIDAKAMRKIREGDTIAGVLEVGQESGTVSMQAFLDTRILDKLP